MYALSRNGNHLAFLDKNIQTFDIALMLVLTSKSFLKFVSEEFVEDILKKMIFTIYGRIYTQSIVEVLIIYKMSYCVEYNDVDNVHYLLNIIEYE